MTIWLNSDPHLGKDKHYERILEWCGRPRNYNERILRSLSQVKAKDIIYCMGDFSFHDCQYWTKEYNDKIEGTSVLVYGNHDKKSYTFYYRNGFNFVCHSVEILHKKKRILLSHKPRNIKGTHYDYNIHGHFHNIPNERWEEGLKSNLTDKHLLISPELLNYQLVTLDYVLDNVEDFKTLNRD